jgi:hypothetical protein
LADLDRNDLICLGVIDEEDQKLIIKKTTSYLHLQPFSFTLLDKEDQFPKKLEVMKNDIKKQENKNDEIKKETTKKDETVSMVRAWLEENAEFM